MYSSRIAFLKCFINENDQKLIHGVGNLFVANPKQMMNSWLMGGWVLAYSCSLFLISRKQ